MRNYERIKCELDYITIENENGIEVDGVCCTCTKCGKSEESFGTGQRSINRCLLMLYNSCDCGNNFYYISNTQD